MSEETGKGPAKAVLTSIYPKWCVEILDVRFSYGNYQNDCIEVASRINRALAPLTRKAALCERMESPEMMERLAAIEHERWSGWIKHQFKTWDTVRVERWKRLAETPYAELTEALKELDRVEVRKTLDAIKAKP